MLDGSASHVKRKYLEKNMFKENKKKRKRGEDLRDEDGGIETKP